VKVSTFSQETPHVSHESQDAAEAGRQFQRLVEIMARLRAPDGCPWDQQQTFDTIKPYLLEEAYEVMDAIDARDWPELREELGDLLLQPVFFARMAQEAGHFAVADSLAAINAKLIRRHPHVFGDGDAKTPEAVKVRWDEIKQQEAAAKGKPPRAMLDGVSRAAPALVEAQQLTSKAAAVGFDWENREQVLDKLREELDELARAQTPAEQEDELGDLLFVLVNLARFLRVDAEQALRRTNAKFRRRFGYIEQQLAAQGKPWRETSLDEMEALWQQAKQTLKSGN